MLQHIISITLTLQYGYTMNWVTKLRGTLQCDMSSNDSTIESIVIKELNLERKCIDTFVLLESNNLAETTEKDVRKVLKANYRGALIMQEELKIDNDELVDLLYTYISNRKAKVLIAVQSEIQSMGKLFKLRNVQEIYNGNN